MFFFIQDDNKKDATTITTPSDKDGNQPDVVFTGQNVLFKARTHVKERPRHAFRAKRKPLLHSEVPRFVKGITKLAVPALPFCPARPRSISGAKCFTPHSSCPLSGRKSEKRVRGTGLSTTAREWRSLE